MARVIQVELSQVQVIVFQCKHCDSRLSLPVAHPKTDDTTALQQLKACPVCGNAASPFDSSAVGLVHALRATSASRVLLEIPVE